MKLKAIPSLKITADTIWLGIPFQMEKFYDLEEFIGKCEQLDIEKDVVLKIENRKPKKSNNQNALLWELIGRIAKKLNIPHQEVYKKIIRENGSYNVVPIQEKAITYWVKNWESQGLGYMCEDLGECAKTKGYHNILCTFGSSSYNSTELNRLIDATISECKELNIPTDAPEYIEYLEEIGKK